jgi:arylsulfatase A
MEVNRRKFLKTIGFGTLSLGLFCFLQASKKSSTRPNLIFVMADDLGYEGLSCYGSKSYSTPELDKLANTGIKFDFCYSTPLCTPSRVQLMTGKYNFRNYTEFGSLPKGEFTFGHLFQQAEYKTCVVGKWQLAGRITGTKYRGQGTLPEDAGFDEHCLWQVKDRGSRFWNPIIQQNGELKTDLEGKYGPDIFCEYINDFVKRNKSNPFFVYFPMALTHNPFIPTPDSKDLSQGLDKRDPKYFKDMVEYTDKIVGKIVENLDNLGLRENTLVIFTGDNGTNKQIVSQMENHTIRGDKGNTTDAGTHVPLIINWQGKISPGKICTDLIDFTDFFPTLAEVANIRLPENEIFDGRSFMPQLFGEKGNPREWVFCFYKPKWGKRNLKRYVHDKKWKLYHNGRIINLEDDPLEKYPISYDDLDEETKIRIKRFQDVLDRMK